MRERGRREGSEWKRIELTLDTAQILIVIAMLLGLCATSFYLGRWIERDRWNEIAGKGANGTPKLSDADAAEDLTFFDTLGGRTAEPARELRKPRGGAEGDPAAPARGTSDAAEGAEIPDGAPAGRTAPARSEPPGVGSQAAPGGGFSVQVFAGERSQAEKIAASLSRKGYGARLLEGTASGKVRVRVSGYKTKSEADAAAERLKREENLNPWVVKGE